MKLFHDITACTVDREVRGSGQHNLFQDLCDIAGLAGAAGSDLGRAGHLRHRLVAAVAAVHFRIVQRRECRCIVYL